MPRQHFNANKFVRNYDDLSALTSAYQKLGFKIVTTIGSWDLLHIGHVRYLLQAKSHGDILIAGVDSDRGIKLYKGPLRPVVPEGERVEMLTYQSCVDFVTLIDDVEIDTGWQYTLLDKIRPDVFIAVEDSYPEEQCADIKKRCGELIVLPRQAENTSTSHMIQTALKGHLEEMLRLVGGGRP